MVRPDKNLKYAIFSIAIFLSIFSQGDLFAAEVYLKNSDKITGIIVNDNAETLDIETLAFGVVNVKKDFIVKIVNDADIKSVSKAEERPQLEAISTREITAGYTLTDGNTENRQLLGSFLLSRNRVTVDEITLKGSAYYSSSYGENDAEKYNVMARYAYSFGLSRKWYNFYKIEGGRDKFADIEYRLVPSIGLGYWCYDMPNLKLLVESAIGLEHTNYRGAAVTDDKLTFIPRAYYETKIFRNSRFTQDVTFYNSFNDLSEYRIHSETELINPINDKLAVNFSFIDDYVSNPPPGVEENDMRFISSLKYNF